MTLRTLSLTRVRTTSISIDVYTHNPSQTISSGQLHSCQLMQ
jgi:hypothetical protein